jgi:membrane-associated phospholipid phosphatase
MLEMQPRTLEREHVDACSICERLASLFWLKTLGSTFAISSFFVLYFVILKHPVFTVRVMPVLPPDIWIPIMPSSVWVYFSLWIYICIPSSMMHQAGQLGAYLLGAFLTSVIGLSVFFFFPTAVPAWEIDWSQYRYLHFLKDSDASGNACPSLHVAFAVYSGFWLARMLRIVEVPWPFRIVNALWAVLIVLSTMTTKQHVLVDVLAGVLLGALVFWLNDRVIRSLGLSTFKQAKKNSVE